MLRTFGTTCHALAGQSRTAAIKGVRGARIDRELEARGVSPAPRGHKGLARSSGGYKNVDDVVEVVHNAGPVAQGRRMRRSASSRDDGRSDYARASSGPQRLV